MKAKRRSRRKRKKRFFRLLFVLTFFIAGTAAIGIIFYGVKDIHKKETMKSPEELLVEYMDHIPKQEYEEMYAMIDVEASDNISQKDFIKRNSAIYEGIEIQNMKVDSVYYDNGQNTVTYQTSFDTAAGNISFENSADFIMTEDGYRLVWHDTLIFPELRSSDKVKVVTAQAKRGEILDRNDRVLAGWGTASSVGIVPGKMTDQESVIPRIAELLEIDPEMIEKKLSAKWMKEDSFVPVKTIPKVEEIQLMSLNPDEEVLQEKQRQEDLLSLPGVMISDTEIRTYPLGKAAAHLIGYVQNVTAEDLEEHAGEGYTANSVIGRSGMEGLFETELKGQNGCRIYIVDSEGNEKADLAYTAVKPGQNILFISRK